MEIPEFLTRVASEPERSITRTVWTTPPDVLARAARQGGMSMTDFLAAPGRRSEQRQFRYGHVLGEPISRQTIEAWDARHPLQPLAGDLRALVMQMNGIHLWANLETGRSYHGLAPVEEWDLARIKMYGPTANSSFLGDRYVALSYHQDGAAFVVLDVVSGTYFLMDTAGADTSAPIASNAAELLDWLWQDRITPSA